MKTMNSANNVIILKQLAVHKCTICVLHYGNTYTSDPNQINVQ